MRLRHAISIRTRLAVAFGAAFLLVILVGLLGIAELHSVSGAVVELRDRALPRLEGLGEIKRAGAQYRSLGLREAETADEHQLRQIGRATEAARDAIATTIRSYAAVADTEEERRILASSGKCGPPTRSTAGSRSTASARATGPRPCAS
jgi:hypothetical protein